MKIAYLIHCNFEGDLEKSGVFKKIRDQLVHWISLGHEAAVFHVTRTDFEKIKDIPCEWFVFRYKKGFYENRLKSWGLAIDAILAWSPDVVYHRYDLWYPPFSLLGRRVPIVLEINTDDIKESYIHGSKARHLYIRLTRKFILKNAAGIIHTTHELAKSKNFDFNKPYKVIANGINLSEYTILQAPKNSNVHLAFIGSNGQPWHGVDKILRLAEKRRDWIFDLIGIIPADKKIPNVNFYGPMSREKYEHILARADAAFGTLALHRKGLNEASPLKVREYLAYGLPVIIGYKDTDFLNGAPFILELPNTENNVDEGEASIEEFIKRWRGRRVSRDDVQNIDSKAKEKERLIFFEFIKNNWRKKDD